LAHPLHRIPIEEFITEAVIEKDTHQVTNLVELEAMTATRVQYRLR
jgi:hypothetical protein